MREAKAWAALVVLSIAASATLAAVRTVPGQYAGIQAAIDEAQDGDVIIVAPGTYREIIDFKGKNVVVRSTDPNDPETVAATIIAFTKSVPRGTTPEGSVVTFANGEGSGAVLAGFTITGGYGTFLPSGDTERILWGAGVLCVGSSPTIMCNVLVGNNGPLGTQTGSPIVYGYGGAIACAESDAVVVRNVIRDNAAYAGAGVFVYGGTPRIADNLIYSNSATYGGGALLLYGGDLVNNTVVRNTAGTGGGLYLISDPGMGYYDVTNNIISGSLGGGGVVWETSYDGDRIAFNDIWGNVGGSDFLWSGAKNSDGNISQDPMVLSATTGDLHLHMDSPCINAGDPCFAEAAGETDAYGAPRISHGRVDMGAAEFAGDLRPVADAGPDQSETIVPAVVTLNGDGSYDPDRHGLSYRWSQVSGPPVTLDVDGPIARFTPGGYGAFVFELVVNDGVFDSFPDRVRIVLDNGCLPVAEAGLPAYTAGESVTLNGGGSYDPDNSGLLYYHWRQTSGPEVQMANADTASPTVSGFVRTDELQVCIFELTVDDGRYTGLPATVEVRVVPNTPGITLSDESGGFDANRPTIIYFGGGDCITGSGGWGSTAWSQRANVLSFSYQPDGPRVSGGTYERCGDAIVLYLSHLAPDYKMPIQTIGYSTGGQPAIDAALRLNRTYKDARYAVNRITFTDGRCRAYAQSILEFLTNPVDGEQCWIDSYDSAPQFYPGILNVHIALGNHATPPQYYRTSLTNANMNNFNDGLVAGAYWSVIGPGKNLQLALAPRREIYEFRGYDAVSPGYEFMQFYDEANYPARLPEPVTLLAPIDVGDPCGVVLTCKPSQNAVGYQLLLGRDPYRVMDFNVVSDTPAPPDKIVRTLPFEVTWWTVRVRDAYGTTIYADPVPIRAFNLSLPVANLGTGRRYATIQDAVDSAGAGDELCLQPGIYHENIHLAGNGLTIRSTNPDDPAVAVATVVDGDGRADALSFSGTADTSLTLAGVTIRNGLNGVYCSGASLTLTGCTVAGNRLAGVKLWSQSHLTAANCVVAGNKGAGIEMWAEKAGRSIPYNYAITANCTIVENGGNGIWGGKPTVANSILWNNAGDEVTGDTVVVTYCDVQGGYAGPGNIDADPCFVQAGSWTGGVWVQGDYHLKSQGGRWSLQAGVWVRDEVTSPCIDAGDPASPLGQESTTLPGVGSANVRINMGAYGGTAQASLAP